VPKLAENSPDRFLKITVILESMLYQSKLIQEAQLPQRNSASAVHVYLGWLTDRAKHRTPHNRRGCIIFWHWNAL